MKLYLIDGYGFVFRAYYSLPPLSRPDGLPIGAVYGFTNMLYKLLDNHAADLIGVVLDSGKKTFRQEIYSQYKANRPPAPEDLVVQLPVIREVIEAFNVKALEKPGFEADDLIATYAKTAEARGYEVTIISSDKDLMQLVGEKVKMLDPLKDRLMDVAAVEEKLGVPPHQVLDYMALIGDSSDNIPGVKGIGPKAATELLKEYSTLDAVYQNLDNIQQKRRRELLEEGREMAFLSRQLAKLREDVPLEVSLEELKAQEINLEYFGEFCQKQGFKALLAKVAAHKVTSHQPKAKIEVVYKPIHDMKELMQAMPRIEQAGVLGFYEQGPELMLSWGNEHYTITLKAKQNEDETQATLFSEADESLTISNIAEVLRPIFTSKRVLKVGLEVKSFIKKLLSQGIETEAFHDIGVMAYALRTEGKNYKLEELLTEFVPAHELAPTAHAVLTVYQELLPLLRENRQLSLYMNIEQPLIKCLAQMELRGVKLDVAYLHSLSEEFKSKIKELETRIYQLAGREFNVGSSKQLSELLFDELGLTGEKKLKSGTYTTRSGTLERLAVEGHEIADVVLEWRQFSKLVNTYTDALPKVIDKRTGRVHTTFSITATNSGRLASSDPNLQNIPIRSDEGNRIRQAFIAEKGKVIISADYSQIELRLLAHMAGIESLQKAFQEDKDIHAITASQMFGIPPEQVDDHLRRRAKTINFGIIYGISAFGLAQRLKMPQQAAKTYIEAYFKQYPGIQAYMNEMIEYAGKHGYVKTLMGRKCMIPGINDRNYSVRSGAERVAINAPLQGTAADIIKKAIIQLPASISKYLILQIHDELLLEVPVGEVDSCMAQVKQAMEGVTDLSVPLKVDVRYGTSWAEAH
jgi:DNA polymerase-1